MVYLGQVGGGGEMLMLQADLNRVSGVGAQPDYEANNLMILRVMMLRMRIRSVTHSRETE